MARSREREKVKDRGARTEEPWECLRNSVTSAASSGGILPPEDTGVEKQENPTRVDGASRSVIFRASLRHGMDKTY